MAKKPKLVTKAAYAKMRGCTQAAVTWAIRTGRISEEPGGLIDPEKADREWVANSATRLQPPQPDAEPEGKGAKTVNHTQAMLDARLKRETEEARLAELKRMELEGELVNAEEVRMAVWGAFRTLRDTAMPLGRRLAGQLVPMNSTRAIQGVIDEAMRGMLADFQSKLIAPTLQRSTGKAGKADGNA